MLRNFFKVSIRNLVRNKAYSIINILGLSIGMACSIIIFLFIFDELSYDRYHEKSDEIYRVGIDGVLQGNAIKGFVTGAPVGRTFKNEIPEIINSTRVVRLQFDESKGFVKNNDKKFIEEGLFYVDSSYFDIFDVEFIQGNPEKVLRTPYTIVVTESIAKKYFDDVNVVGKSLTIENKEYIIQAVIKDCPSNSHMHYTILASIISTEASNYETWMSNDFSYTYLLLDKNADLELVENKMFEVGIKYVEPELLNMFGVKYDDFVSAGNKFKYILQPLKDIHLKSQTDYEIEANSNIVYVYIFSIIAIFILLIAIINFMNLSTARSATRAKEVGIRKVIGALRKNLFSQFLFESIIMSFISMIIGMVIIESVLPMFNSFTLKNLSIGYFSNVYVIPSLILLSVMVGLISGLYSASYLSSSKVLNVIKGKVLSGAGHSWFRSFLVVFQFAISITLFICTFIIYNQLNLLRNQDIGFEKRNILVIEKANELGNSFDSFKEELSANPLVKNLSASNTLPARNFGGFPIALEGDASRELHSPRLLCTDSEFAKTYELKIKEGRFFSSDFATDTFAILLNEAAVEEFKLEYPVVGKRFVSQFGPERIVWNVIGVVKDFNYRSLHQEIAPLIITSPIVGGPNLISVKLKSPINEEAIKYIKEEWSKFLPDTPFEYYIMEEDFDNQHSEEFRTGDVFLIFSILAIFIACLGLSGLASFMAEQKTKEIGIRKAMGASTYKIVSILLTQFTKWVLWANIIAWPVAYLFMDKWLQNFAYRVAIQWWIFIVSSLLGLIIAMVTVSFRAVRAANANPVDSLRYE